MLDSIKLNYSPAVKYILDKMRQQLPDNLRYHSIEHTLAVLKASEFLAEKLNITSEDKNLLLTAAAYHDSGFTTAYKNHETVGTEIAQEALPQFGFTQTQIDKVKQMIMATKIPQSPQTELEKILCDADLEYLGGEDYAEISETLLEELKLNGNELSAKDWLNMQIGFLEIHHFWTSYGLEVLTPKKQHVLAKLKEERAKME